MPTFFDALPDDTSEFFKGLDLLPFLNRRQPGDAGNAWFCAEASALAYKKFAFVNAPSPNLAANGWTARAFDLEPTQVVLLLNDSLAVLAFRGTRLPGFPDLLHELLVNPRDLVTDLDAKLVPHPKRGRVHRGFFRGYTDLWQKHRAEILAAIGDRTLFVTGHSLGAALATVAARDLENVAALYVFGSPRVGDQEFCEGFTDIELPVFRFVHGFDFVTTLPPESLGYRHVTAPIHVADPDGELSRKPQHTAIGALRENLRHLPGNIGAFFQQIAQPHFLDLPNFQLPNDALADHAPINYTRQLHQAALRSRTLPD